MVVSAVVLVMLVVVIVAAAAVRVVVAVAAGIVVVAAAAAVAVIVVVVDDDSVWLGLQALQCLWLWRGILPPTLKEVIRCPYMKYLMYSDNFVFPANYSPPHLESLWVVRCLDLCFCYHGNQLTCK